MKAIRTIAYAAAAMVLAAAVMLSCSRYETAGQVRETKGTISVSVNGELGELVPDGGTKSSLSNPIRLKWEENDKVYAFDGATCLGELNVTLKEGKDYYALLSGDLDTPAEGTTKITLVHATGFSAERGELMSAGRLSFDLSTQSGTSASAPFVAYATMGYSGQTSIEELVVSFEFATSVIRVNCSGLEPGKSFTTIISGMSNECVLQISGDGAGVQAGNIGVINLAGTTTNAQGTKALYAGLAKTAAASAVSVVATQGNKSYEGSIANSSAWAAKTAYNSICPVSIAPYIVINGLKWAKQNLAISPSGNKTWKPSGSAVKVPGTDWDVINGDYFQWAAYEGYAQVEEQTVADRGLLIYESFTSKACGDGSDAFEFKSPETGRKFFFSTTDYGDEYEYINISPYHNGTQYTVYNPNIDSKYTLESTDDVANIILGGNWRMPTSAEFQAMKDTTYWSWDATDKGYYVYAPNPSSDAGKVNGNGTGTYNKSNALLFFPAANFGNLISFNNGTGSLGHYFTSSLDSSLTAYASTLYFKSSYVNPNRYGRSSGLTVRPVSD